VTADAGHGTCPVWIVPNSPRVDKKEVEQRAGEHALTQASRTTDKTGEPRWPKVVVEEIAKPRNRRPRRSLPRSVQRSCVLSRRLHHRQQSKALDSSGQIQSHRCGQTSRRRYQAVVDRRLVNTALHIHRVQPGRNRFAPTSRTVCGPIFSNPTALRVLLSLPLVNVTWPVTTLRSLWIVTTCCGRIAISPPPATPEVAELIVLHDRTGTGYTLPASYHHKTCGRACRVR